jgi:hypothetical protein
VYGFAGGDPVNFGDPFGLCASAADRENGADEADADSTKKAKLDCTYRQNSGRLSCADESGKTVVDETGYAGRGFFKNWSAAESNSNWGPIPRGKYAIGGFTASKGPVTITLTPYPENIMYGRDLFRIHGDSKKHPGAASNGCIIVGRDTRNTIAGSSGSTLTVVP